MIRLLKRLSSKPYVISFLVLFQLFLVYVALYQLTAWIPLLYVFFVGLSIALSIYIISLDINPAYKLSWIFMILSLPLIESKSAATSKESLALTESTGKYPADSAQLS